MYLNHLNNFILVSYVLGNVLYCSHNTLQFDMHFFKFSVIYVLCVQQKINFEFSHFLLRAVSTELFLMSGAITLQAIKLLFYIIQVFIDLSMIFSLYNTFISMQDDKNQYIQYTQFTNQVIIPFTLKRFLKLWCILGKSKKIP